MCFHFAPKEFPPLFSEVSKLDNVEGQGSDPHQEEIEKEECPYISGNLF